MSRIEKKIEVDAPVTQCFQLWTDFENLPRFMKHIKAIRPAGDDLWHWVVTGPVGKEVSWDARVDKVEPSKRVSWHSLPNSEVSNAGMVIFEAISPTRTLIQYYVEYNPPGGKLGELVADLFSNPDKMADEDLQNFKNLVESEATPAGVTRGGQPGMMSGTSDFGPVGSETDQKLWQEHIE